MKIAARLTLLAAVLLALFTSHALGPAPALAYQTRNCSTNVSVEALPTDNLIHNPWFDGGDDTGWTHNDLWTYSLKSSHPSPTSTCTYARKAGGSSFPGGLLDADDIAVTQTIVQADPSANELKLTFWAVVIRAQAFTVDIAGSDSPDGPWVPLWTVEPQWAQPSWDFFEFSHPIESGYSHYQISFRVDLPANGGVKFTGIYFAAHGGTGQPAALPPVSNDHPGGRGCNR
jgi:hypothetical protein